MFYLFVFIVVIQYPYDSRAAYTGGQVTQVKQWVNQGLFNTGQSCADAANKLGYNATNARCIPK
jgi:hypothetical protein